MDLLTQCNDLIYVTKNLIKSGWPHHLISLIDLFYSNEANYCKHRPFLTSSCSISSSSIYVKPHCHGVTFLSNQSSISGNDSNILSIAISFHNQRTNPKIISYACTYAVYTNIAPTRVHTNCGKFILLLYLWFYLINVSMPVPLYATGKDPEICGGNTQQTSCSLWLTFCSLLWVCVGSLVMIYMRVNRLSERLL